MRKYLIGFCPLVNLQIQGNRWETPYLYTILTRKISGQRNILPKQISSSTMSLNYFWRKNSMTLYTHPTSHLCLKMNSQNDSNQTNISQGLKEMGSPKRQVRKLKQSFGSSVQARCLVRLTSCLKHRWGKSASSSKR